MNWLTRCEGAIKKHGNCLKNGLDRSTLEVTKYASDYKDGKILTRVLNYLALDDISKLRNFVATIPRNTLAQLMRPPIKSGVMALREPLLTLLRSCVGISAVGPDEYVRRRSLFVCLEAVRHVAEALIDPNADSQPDVLYDVRINFANISLMRAMWADADAAIRVTSRSICALLARCLIHRGQLDGSELAWLQDVIEESPRTIYNSPVAELDHMNLKSFVYSLLSHQAGDLPKEHVASFERTLVILMGIAMPTDADIDRAVLKTGLQNLIQRMKTDGYRGSFAATALCQMYESILQPSASAPCITFDNPPIP